MQAVLNFLQGKKTYITAILFAIYNLGIVLNLWTADNATWTAVNTILGALGLAFLRSAVANITQSVPPTK